MVRRTLFIAALIIATFQVEAHDVGLEFVMPAELLHPEAPFYVFLSVTNETTEDIEDVEVYIALTIGTGEYWFFPSWSHFPSDIDSIVVDVMEWYGENVIVFPESTWPVGAGEFDNAMLIAAAMKSGSLISNIAEKQFSWTEAPSPTPKPTPVAPEGMVFVPAGYYWRGSFDDEPCRVQSQETRHHVTLTRSLFVMKTEVTRQMWADLKSMCPELPDDPSFLLISPLIEHPVQRVNWWETLLFANLLSELSSFTPCYYKDKQFKVLLDESNYNQGYFYCDIDANGFRLPTDGEWEYFARATSTGAFYLDEPNYNEDNCWECDEAAHQLPVLDSIAWWCGNAPDQCETVGTKIPNSWGIYDVIGNVSEWMWDWWYYHPKHPVTDPDTSQLYGYHRSIRGDGLSFPRYSRLAACSGAPPNSREWNVGFRLIRTVSNN